MRVLPNPSVNLTRYGRLLASKSSLPDSASAREYHFEPCGSSCRHRQRRLGWSTTAAPQTAAIRRAGDHRTQWPLDTTKRLHGCGRRPAYRPPQQRVTGGQGDSGFVLGRYTSPTTFNEARRGRLDGQSCRRNSAVLGHVLTEAITVSCHRVRRSDCDAVTTRPVAHPLLSPCHTAYDTVIALAH